MNRFELIFKAIDLGLKKIAFLSLFNSEDKNYGKKICSIKNIVEADNFHEWNVHNGLEIFLIAVELAEKLDLFPIEIWEKEKYHIDYEATEINRFVLLKSKDKYISIGNIYQEIDGVMPCKYSRRDH